MEFREVFSYALSLLLRRDYSEKALTEKLRKKFPEVCREELLRVVEELSAQGFLDEYRAVWSYFELKVKKGWGRRKIAFSLRQKGFKPEVIKEVELSFPFDYSYAVREVLKKYPHDRLKAKRFLLQRGFTFCEVDRILREAGGEPPTSE
ncbi:regulatory protein RecX [Thermovibrio sp.]